MEEHAGNVRESRIDPAEGDRGTMMEGTEKKRGRGRPRKKDEMEERGEKDGMERFLTRGEDQKDQRKDIFATRSKIRHTPTKGGQGGDKEQEKRMAGGGKGVEAHEKVERQEGKGKDRRVEEGHKKGKEEEEKQDKKEVESSSEDSALESEKDETERKFEGHWWREIRKAEERSRRAMGESNREMERKIKGWWREELKREMKKMEEKMKRWFTEVLEAYREKYLTESSERVESTDEGGCESCERNQRKIKKLKENIRELKEKAEEEKRQGYKQGDKVGTGREKGGCAEKLLNQEEKGKKGGREEINDSLDEVSEASMSNQTGVGEDEGNRSVKELRLRKQIRVNKPLPMDEKGHREEKGRRENRRSNVCIYYEADKGLTKERVMEEVARKCRQDVKRITEIKYDKRGVLVLRFKNR